MLISINNKKCIQHAPFIQNTYICVKKMTYRCVIILINIILFTKFIQNGAYMGPILT